MDHIYLYWGWGVLGSKLPSGGGGEGAGMKPQENAERRSEGPGRSMTDRWETQTQGIKTWIVSVYLLVRAWTK